MSITILILLEGCQVNNDPKLIAAHQFFCFEDLYCHRRPLAWWGGCGAGKRHILYVLHAVVRTWSLDRVRLIVRPFKGLSRFWRVPIGVAGCRMVLLRGC